MICGSWVSPKTDAMWQANMAETIFICTCFKLTYSSSGRWFWLASLGFLRVALRSSKTAGWTPTPLVWMIFPRISTTINGYFPPYFPTQSIIGESDGFSDGFSNGFSHNRIGRNTPRTPKFCQGALANENEDLWPSALHVLQALWKNWRMPWENPRVIDEGFFMRKSMNIIISRNGEFSMNIQYSIVMLD